MTDTYLKLKENQIHVGRSGEQLVLAQEKQRLAGTGLADRVDGSFAQQNSPYDIKSCTPCGDLLYIEVKTTDGEADVPFFMSAVEYEFMLYCRDAGVPYQLHRVYNVLDSDKRGEITYTPQELTEMFQFEPASYVCTAKERPVNMVDWVEYADRIPGTKCRLYVAKIGGADPKFHFDRDFLRGDYVYFSDRIRLSCQLEENVVYECGMKWETDDGIVIQRKRKWFMVNDGVIVDIDYQDVLTCVQRLKSAG